MVVRPVVVTWGDRQRELLAEVRGIRCSSGEKKAMAHDKQV